MESKDIQKILDWFSRSNLSRLEIESEDVKLRMQKADDGTAMAGGMEASGQKPADSAAEPVRPARGAEAAAADARNSKSGDAGDAKGAEAPARNDGEYICSPLVGIFYRAPKPGAAPFAEEGGKVRKGDVLCVVEAMKMMNEIKAPYDLTVRRCLMEDGKMAEAGARLFEVEKC